MYRYGVDMRYAKSTLVVYRDHRMSFYDIKESFMPKIRTLWHKFQNCIVQDTTAFVIDQDGKVIWHGNSASQEMDKSIAKALGN